MPDPEVEFEAMVAARYMALLRSARLLVGDWAKAEDLVQASLVKTWLHWGSLREVQAAEAYTRRVMVSIYGQWWRRRSYAERPRESVDQGLGHDPYPLVDERLVLQRALASLSWRQRSVVVLRFFDDMTEVQVAEALGVSLGTVKSTTARALDRLRASGLVLDPDDEHVP